jgi:hypothetical protein
MSEGRQRHTHGSGQGGAAWFYSQPHSRGVEDEALNAASQDYGDEQGAALWEYITSDDFGERDMYAVACWCMGRNTLFIAKGLGVGRERARQILERALARVFEHFNGRAPRKGEVRLIAMRGPNPRNRKRRSA